MKCPKCQHEWKLPGPQAGGRKGGKKGFAVKPLSAASRRKAWKTRKRIADLEDKLKHAERIGGFSFSPNPKVHLRELGERKVEPVVGLPNQEEK